MLPRRFRTTFKNFISNPNPTQTYTVAKYFNLLFKKSESTAPKFVIIVPKSVSKHSCCRHQAKRILIEAVRKNLDKMVGFKDIMVKIKKKIDKQDKSLLEKEVIFLFGKIGLLDKSRIQSSQPKADWPLAENIKCE